MALGTGLGIIACLFFGCWCLFIYLYWKQRTLVKVLSKMKFKLSDDNITMENLRANDTSSMESDDLFSVDLA